MKILSGDINVQFRFSKMTNGNENVRENIRGNGDGAVNSAASKHFFDKSIVFPHRNIHQCTWTTPDGKTSNTLFTPPQIRDDFQMLFMPSSPGKLSVILT
jgi:hypothetical protein